jgi:hypothetical protein
MMKIGTMAIFAVFALVIYAGATEAAAQRGRAGQYERILETTKTIDIKLPPVARLPEPPAPQATTQCPCECPPAQ